MFLSDVHKYPATIFTKMYVKNFKSIYYTNEYLYLNRLLHQTNTNAPFSFSAHQSFNKLQVSAFSSSQGLLN